MTDKSNIAKKLIREGKRQGNQSMIELGQRMLGEVPKVEPPKIITEVPKDADYIFRMDKPREEDRMIYDADGKPTGKMRTKSEPLDTSKKENSFIDNGLEGHDKENEKLKRISKKKGLTPRDRPEFKMAKIRCDDCGVQFEIHPGLIRTGEGSVNRCEKCVRKMRPV
jgi:hypothetical protein